eukprot:scaffold79081_cov66-Phaeocystis_antarctica.AAC.1
MSPHDRTRRFTNCIKEIRAGTQTTFFPKFYLIEPAPGAIYVICFVDCEPRPTCLDHHALWLCMCHCDIERRMYDVDSEEQLGRRQWQGAPLYHVLLRDAALQPKRCMEQGEGAHDACGAARQPGHHDQRIRGGSPLIGP